MKYGGALPMQRIRELLAGGFIEGAQMGNVRTGSLDLTPSSKFFRVRGSFLPGHHETVEDALKRVGAVRIARGSVLERGACYVCRLEESVVHLPDGVYAYANPKSSSGRLDLHVRMLSDHVSRYDSIPKNYKGPLWMLIAPKTFSVKVPIGIPLNQIRFFTEDTRLDQLRLETSFEQNGGLLSNAGGEMIKYHEIIHSDKDGSIILTLGLDYEYSGFEAVATGEEIDLSLVNHYDPTKFFRPIRVTDDSLTLAANTFYILSSREFVRVPENFACEMAPMDERSGELRSHYAGFIDSGWGIGTNGLARGRPLTLEVRSFDNSLIIKDGQPITKIRYELMIENPEEHYDHMAPNYGKQSGPQLSKHFLSWGR